MNDIKINNMKKVIKLTERDLTRLVKRVIRESEDSYMETMDGDLPKCDTLMKSESDATGASKNLVGPFDKITANFTVSPMYQGYTLYKNGKKFCFIPK
jgi:hypothetical protein